MNKIIAFSFLTICCFSTYSQELKAKKVKTLTYVEEYTLLASDKKIKHGDYKKYRSDGTQSWSGKIDNNTRVGDWSYFENGKLDQTYNYDTKSVTFQGKSKDPSFIFTDNKIQLADLDSSPGYVGSKIGLTDELNKVVKYPIEARRMGIEGKIILGIWINQDGTIGNIELSRGIKAGCDEEIMEALKKIPTDWISGTLAGNKLTSKLILTIEFKLDNLFENKAVTAL
jgi:TonB family protein